MSGATIGFSKTNPTNNTTPVIGNYSSTFQNTNAGQSQFYNGAGQPIAFSTTGQMIVQPSQMGQMGQMGQAVASPVFQPSQMGQMGQAVASPVSQTTPGFAMSKLYQREVAISTPNYQFVLAKFEVLTVNGKKLPFDPQAPYFENVELKAILDTKTEKYSRDYENAIVSFLLNQKVQYTKVHPMYLAAYVAYHVSNNNDILIEDPNGYIYQVVDGVFVLSDLYHTMDNEYKENLLNQSNLRASFTKPNALESVLSTTHLLIRLDEATVQQIESGYVKPIIPACEQLKKLNQRAFMTSMDGSKSTFPLASIIPPDFTKHILLFGDRVLGTVSIIHIKDSLLHMAYLNDNFTVIYNEHVAQLTKHNIDVKVEDTVYDYKLMTLSQGTTTISIALHLKTYSNVAQTLASVQIPTQAVGYFDGNYYATKLAAYCLYKRIIPVLIEDVTSQYVSLLTYYNSKGFMIDPVYCPTLDNEQLAYLKQKQLDKTEEMGCHLLSLYLLSELEDEQRREALSADAKNMLSSSGQKPLVDKKMSKLASKDLLTTKVEEEKEAIVETNKTATAYKIDNTYYRYNQRSQAAIDTYAVTWYHWAFIPSLFLDAKERLTPVLTSFSS